MSDNAEPTASQGETGLSHGSDLMVHDPVSPRRESYQSHPGGQIDVAVHFMLPVKDRSDKDEFGVKDVHDMDTKFVQTAASEMTEGDTLICLDVPKGHKPNRSCSGGSFPLSYRLRFPSRLLRTCGFDLFPRLLDDPKYQTKSRARLAAKELIPEGVDYILHLGPSTDEDLHSSHLETLTLSKGLVRWYRTEFVPPNINLALVAGHDDCCECGSNPQLLQATGKQQGCLWDRQGAEPRFRDIEDYCEVRHAANVVRLLRRILGRPGGQLILDSAPRVFTIVGLAKLFEINLSDQSTWLRDDILSWFLGDANSEIIEILTEDAILMGYSAKIPKVTRAAYRVLASEYALQLESSSPAPPGGHKYSVFGRPLRDINNDVIQTAIEYGGQALAERVLGVLARLESPNALDWLCPEWKKMRLLESKIERALSRNGIGNGVAVIQDACNNLKKALFEVIRSRIADARMLSAKNADATETYETNLSHFVPASHHHGFLGFWAKLNDNQRTLTSVFWKNLGERWPESVDVETIVHFGLKRLAQDLNDALNKHGFAINHYVPEYLDIHRLFTQLGQGVKLWVRTLSFGGSTPDLSADKQELSHVISSHMLLGLNENEMRFLPLWADGLNDESGGVYDNSIPPPLADLGPSGPGPSFHTGQTVGTETTNSTVGDLGVGDMDIKSYTTATETYAAHRGPSSVGPSTGGPAASEDMDFDNARYAVPAAHQAVGQAISHNVEAICVSGNADDGDSMQFTLDGEDDDDDLGSEFTTPTASMTGDMDTDMDRDSDWSMM